MDDNKRLSGGNCVIGLRSNQVEVSQSRRHYYEVLST